MKTTCCSSMAVLILVFLSIFASLGIATPATPQTADDVSRLSFPGLLPPGEVTDDVNMCATSLQIIAVCAVEMVESILGEKFEPSLGPGCCKTLVAFNDACWPQVFPFNRFFRPMLKFYCAMNGGGASATSPTPSPTPAV